jgi:hypothetical protein
MGENGEDFFFNEDNDANNDELDHEVIVDTYRHVDEYTWPLHFH